MNKPSEEMTELGRDVRRLIKEYEAAMMQMEEALNEARLQRDSYKRLAEMWQLIAKAGLPDVIGAWASEEIGKLLGEEVSG